MSQASRRESPVTERPATRRPRTAAPARRAAAPDLRAAAPDRRAAAPDRRAAAPDRRAAAPDRRAAAPDSPATAPPSPRGTATAASPLWVRTRAELRGKRRRRPHTCWDHLIVAPLWPKYGVNLGTLLRTCDAVGACLAVPHRPWVREALDKGNTLRQPSCVHWVNKPLAWLAAQRKAGSDVVGVELTDESIRLVELRPARRRTVVVLGNESDGIPSEATALLDVAVEIPMLGTGLSLNVAVAGSLVAYKLAGLV